jgi:hypothetical protein
MHTIGPGIWQETPKNMENEKHSIGPEILRETLKNVVNEKYKL